MSSFPRPAFAAIFLSLLTIAPPGAAQGPPPAPPAPRMAEGPAVSRWPLAGMVTPDDYPEAAIDAQEQGGVTVELEVTTEGRVAACRIVESSDSVSLDRVTCAILTRRARFQPARDAAGQAVRDRVQHKIRWELDALPFEAIAAISIGRTNAAGVIIECRDETVTAMCADRDFDLRDSGLALAGTLPVSAYLIRTMSFTPGDAPAPQFASVDRAGDRPLFAGSARVEVNRNGKVTGCVEIAPVNSRAGSLCRLVTPWLFRIDPDRAETRSGVWNITLSLRPGSPRP